MSRGVVGTFAALSLLTAVSCRESDGPLAGNGGQLVVSSDPEGARILIDEQDTGLLTPDTVPDIGGVHDVLVLLDSAGARFSYGARVVIEGSEILSLSGPVTARCSGNVDGTQLCFRRNSSLRQHPNMAFSLNALGPLFLEDASGQGLMWPAGTNDTYVSNSMPLIAAKVGGRPVSIGMYDITTMAGRPAPVVTNAGGELRTDQKTWLVPATTSRTLVTIRGIEIRQQLLMDAAVPDVALVRITYRNITNSPAYQKLDVRGTDLGSEGFTYDDVFVGFALDPDIGRADDDLAGYDPSIDGVFAWDANFSESTFNSGSAQMPGLIGLRMLQAPGASRIVLNTYGTQGGLGSSSDWGATQSDEGLGWSVLSGTGAYAPDHDSPNIGMMVPDAADVRMMVSAGPYTLRPAEEVSIVVAVALARPVPGTFTPNVQVAPGDPLAQDRLIMRIGADLRARLVAAEGLLGRLSAQ